jgi:D-serine deaminase-like pyridoxal phosphate-dependent protein
VLPRLEDLSQHIKIDLVIDHEQQVALLETSSKPWDVLIKIDVGARRAGLPGNASRLLHLVEKIEASKIVNLKGFYCHANHSYNCRTEEDTKDMLHHEISGVLEAVTLLPSSRQLLVSIGATPTAHVIKDLRAKIPANVSLELHAGRNSHPSCFRICADLD